MVLDRCGAVIEIVYSQNYSLYWTYSSTRCGRGLILIQVIDRDLLMSGWHVISVIIKITM